MSNSKIIIVKPFSDSFLIELIHITHWFGFKQKRTLLNDINFSIRKNRIITISGASGSGKTTLLQIIGGLRRPKQGKVFMGKLSTRFLPDLFVSYLRSRFMGFVFQDYRLLPHYSVKENILLALYFAHRIDQHYMDWFTYLVNKLGINHLLSEKPRTLSGGEKQRVALARALVTKPQILIADEPTGNLDEKNSQRVRDLLLELQAEMQHTLLIVTHDPIIARIGQERYQLEEGVIQSVG